MKQLIKYIIGTEIIIMLFSLFLTTMKCLMNMSRGGNYCNIDGFILFLKGNNLFVVGIITFVAMIILVIEFFFNNNK